MDLEIDCVFNFVSKVRGYPALWCLQIGPALGVFGPDLTHLIWSGPFACYHLGCTQGLHPIFLSYIRDSAKLFATIARPSEILQCLSLPRTKLCHIYKYNLQFLLGHTRLKARDGHSLLGNLEKLLHFVTFEQRTRSRQLIIILSSAHCSDCEPPVWEWRLWIGFHPKPPSHCPSLRSTYHIIFPTSSFHMLRRKAWFESLYLCVCISSIFLKLGLKDAIDIWTSYSRLRGLPREIQDRLEKYVLGTPLSTHIRSYPQRKKFVAVRRIEN